MTGSAGRAGRCSVGWVSKVSNSFLFLREGAGREWHVSAPRPGPLADHGKRNETKANAMDVV